MATTLKAQLLLLKTNIEAKLDALYDKIAQVAPFVGLSPNQYNALTTDAEGKLLYEELTPEEVALFYESVGDVERFTTAHKLTVEDLSGGLQLKADLNPDTMKLRVDQVPQFSITNVVRAAEDTLAGFIANSVNYEYDEGDAIVITYLDAAEDKVRQHYLYDGGDRSLEASYEPFTAKVFWDSIEGKPVLVKTVNGIAPDADGNLTLTIEGSSPTKLVSFVSGWQSGFIYKPFASWVENNVENSDSGEFTLVPPATTGQSRIDVFAVNLNTDLIEVIQGVASDNPVKPDIDPSIYLEGPFVLLEAGTTQPAGNSFNPIYDEGAAAEWNFFKLAGSPVVVNSVNGASSGSVSIEATDLAGTGEHFFFRADVPVPIGEFPQLSLKIKNKEATTGDIRIEAQGEKTNGRGYGYRLVEKLTDFGYDKNNITDWQTITIPVSIPGAVNVSKISFNRSFDNIDVPMSFFIDDIRQVSTSEETISGNYATVEYSDQKDAETLQEAKDYADSLVVSGGDNIHDSYGTMAEMFADQANQIDGEFFIVIDATGDTTVDAGWAMYEYLGTTLGTKDDYRKLSEEESLDVIAPTPEVTQAEFDALASRVTTLENEGGIITVAISRNLTTNDSGKKLLITASVTLTWPSGGIADFECNFDVDAGGQLTIADSAATAGAELDAPDGKILAAGKMGHTYRRPDTGKLRLKGDWTV